MSHITPWLAGGGLLLWALWQWWQARSARQYAQQLLNTMTQQQQQWQTWRQHIDDQLTVSEQQQLRLHGELLQELRAQRQELSHGMRDEVRQLQQWLELQWQQQTTQQYAIGQQQQAQHDAFRQEVAGQLEKAASAMEQHLQAMREQQHMVMKDMRQELQQSLHHAADNNDQRLQAMQQQQGESLRAVSQQFAELRDQLLMQLRQLQQAQEQQLEKIRHTVDEKLQGTLEKRLGESFRQVSRQLEMVHQGLGEMQQLATGVGDLKRVLGNVKTRGILGEYQLGNLLEQMLAPEQYAANVKTRRGSQNVVEYAVRLPGRDEHGEIWLPIDSKFPLESYQLLLGAREQGDRAAIERAGNELRQRIVSFAKDIHDKYIDPPNTTDFAIMFLPVEGLYAEVLQDPAIFETLQRKFRITITGPTTLAALLNSLHMGFRTLAVQKRSSEVWRVLAEVREEFGKFSGQLEKVYQQLDTAQKSLDTLRHTRTNVMQRKLKRVQQISVEEGVGEASGSEPLA